MLTVAVLIFFISANGILADSRHDLRNEKPTARASEGKDYWNTIGQSELNEMLGRPLNTNTAKNVILVLGDGMSINTVTAARIYKGQQEGREGESDFLSFDKFPNTGLSKTYCVDRQTTDSAASGTAYQTGVKTNNGLVGVDASVTRYKCATVTNDSIVHSIAKWSQDAGKMTGFVTSARVTHATPATLYAHSADRGWECDDDISATQTLQCPDLKDIALQLVEDETGSKFNVIMGGGFQYMDGNAVSLPGDPVSSGCKRTDGRVLWQEWLDSKTGSNATFVRNRSELNAVDLNATDYLMGIYSNSHMPYEYEKRELNLDLPTLTEMTEAALTILKKGENGFFLLVEGGRIDLAHHGGKARVALDEVSAMDDAVLKILEMNDEQDTLVVVTADHSHTMTISGYADRGASILGVGGTGEDDLEYTVLSYANGPGYNYSVVNGTVKRMDVSEMNTTDWEFHAQASVPKSSESHGGEDVGIYANGPMSHLFTSVHEENYIAHAMAYASCVGANQDHCSSKGKFARRNRFQ